MTSPHDPPKPTRAENRIASFRYAFAGWGFVLRNTPNAWIHLSIMLAVIAVGLWLRLDLLRWALLVLAMALVWVSELINTAIEAVVDLTSPERHPLAGAAKDVAAAAVLTAAGFSVIIGLLVLGPPLLARLSLF